MPNSVILLDPSGNVLRECEKLYAHKHGLYHEAFSVFIFRTTPENTCQVLLQRRARDKYHSALLWTNTCCSHPTLGKSIQACAEQRLKEEMGFTTSLRHVGVFSYRAKLDHGLEEHERDHVFIGHSHHETVVPNPQEVSEYAWVDHDTAYRNAQATPSQFTAWFLKAYTIALEGVGLDV